MIEIIIKKYLDGHLDVPSFFEHEAEAPDSFVIIWANYAEGCRA